MKILKQYGEDPSLGCVIQTDDDIVFRKVVRKARHFCVKHNGWGISVSIYRDMIKYGVRTIEVFDKDMGRVYTIDIKKFEKNLIKDRLGFEDEQYFTNIKWWDFE